MTPDLMVDNSLVGAIVGAVGRLIPELLNIINKLIDNNQELKMIGQSSNIDSSAVNSREKMSSVDIDLSMVDKILEVTNKPTGNKKIDIVNMLVRPHVTYMLLWTYIMIKVFWFYQNPYTSLETIWSPDDMTLLSGIISFWFLGRVFDKKNS